MATSWAYEEGRTAYKDNKLLLDNPYTLGTKECRAWKDGYERASTANKDY
jgi:hypothetical protein